VGRSEHVVRSNVTAAVYGTGDLVECRRHLVSLLNLTSCLSSRHGTWASTTVAPCKINGIRRPPIDFHNSEFFGFSEFFYTMEDILKMGGPYDTIQFQRAAKVKTHAVAPA
jgi:Golgi nucleoside diphosphatase